MQSKLKMYVKISLFRMLPMVGLLSEAPEPTLLVRNDLYFKLGWLYWGRVGSKRTQKSHHREHPKWHGFCVTRSTIQFLQQINRHRKNNRRRFIARNIH